MSKMMSIFTDVGWPLVGFGIFMLLFMIFVVVTFLPSQIRLHRYLSHLPLQDSEDSTQERGPYGA